MSDVSVPMGNDVGGDFSGETVSEDGQDQGGQEEAQAQAQQRYKLKVNGKEVEKSIDELIRMPKRVSPLTRNFSKRQVWPKSTRLTSKWKRPGFRQRQRPS